MSLMQVIASSRPRGGGGGGVTFVSTGPVSVNTNVTLPTGLANGDILVAFITNITPADIKLPTGWTRAKTDYTWTTYAYATMVAYHVVTNAGSEPSNLAFDNGGGANRSGVIVNYRGSSGLVAAGNFSQTGSTAMGVSAVVGTGLLLSMVSQLQIGTNNSISAPSGMTGRIDSASGGFFHIGIADLAANDAASKAFSVSANAYSAVTISLVL